MGVPKRQNLIGLRLRRDPPPQDGLQLRAHAGAGGPIQEVGFKRFAQRRRPCIPKGPDIQDGVGIQHQTVQGPGGLGRYCRFHGMHYTGGLFGKKVGCIAVPDFSLSST